MPDQKVTHKALLQDIHAGVNDDNLRLRYGLSAEDLQKAIQTLIDAGRLTEEEIEKRRLAPTPKRTCPACHSKISQSFKVCPYCGIVITKYTAWKGRSTVQPHQTPDREEKTRNTQRPIRSKSKQHTPNSRMISCPKCSELTVRAGFPDWAIILAICLFPLGLLALLAGRKPTVCPNCGFAWQT